MGAIAALLARDARPLDEHHIARMVGSMAVRGPDGQGVWREGAVGLGHCAFWTTPEARRERLPLLSADGGLALTADARLDNRAELYARLGLSAPLATLGDGALILAAYERFGEDCPAYLLGDFAFALWDARQRRLFCARDHFGVKPFYYWLGADTFACATEIKALLVVPRIPQRLNETRVGDYLLGLLDDPATTLYRDIVRLPAAHTLTLDERGLRLREYWRLPPDRTLHLGSDADYADAFRQHFERAVAVRLRGDGPLASTLSGGLDSSAVASMARRLLPSDGPPLHTASAIFPDLPQCDEQPYIRAVHDAGDYRAHFVRADRLSPLGGIDATFAATDQASYHPNLFIHQGLYRAVSAAGARVILDGLDGDTTVSHGLVRLTELAREGRLPTLAAEIRGLSRNMGGAPQRYLRQYVTWPLLPSGVFTVWRRVRGRERPTIDPLVAPAFARRIGLAERRAALIGEGMRPPRSNREDHWRRLTRGLNSFVLEIADHAAAALGCEPRYPFFDKRLIEFCLAIPSRQKLDGGLTRVVMRRGLAGILPEPIRQRPGKSNLAPNFDHTFLRHDRAVLDELIAGDLSSIADYVDLPTLRTLYAQCQHGTAGGELTMRLWRATSLALWLRRVDLSV
ncbi:MAG TPA: asparagine synthase-related protein [Thermomicrobiales bacterium]|jgi:asparagine synthase (glutamine-hydrolysing)